ncbi:MAG TPA: hypothetical protein VFM18_09635 [Methanosarcina sp.]|nr:hypothetical protein [Methanosarcina sp.]
MNRANMLLLQSFLVNISGQTPSRFFKWYHRLVAWVYEKKFSMKSWQSCAFGLFSRSKQAKGTGLQFSIHDNHPKLVGKVLFGGFDVAQVFFGVTNVEVMFLFGQQQYPKNAKPIDVLNRVNSFLRLKTLEQRLLFVSLTTPKVEWMASIEAKDNGIKFPEKVTPEYFYEVLRRDEDARTIEIIGQIVQSTHPVKILPSRDLA